MINAEQFGVRLKKVMDHYQLSAASFADEIGVQRSSISHLLSGRNKPSLDFVLKVLERFKEVELYWLLNGKGTFPVKDPVAPSLPSKAHQQESVKNTSDRKAIHRIVIFYNDGSFEDYIP
ncbi:MAG: helix-turn-helix transcriptional regulator [Flavobacteriaceae bacterium]|nr:helix-turn-helix transcriptional regulator [Flavobacteriaceae bacterium]